jgi:hypothetical protein
MRLYVELLRLCIERYSQAQLSWRPEERKGNGVNCDRNQPLALSSCTSFARITSAFVGAIDAPLSLLRFLAVCSQPRRYPPNSVSLSTTSLAFRLFLSFPSLATSSKMSWLPTAFIPTVLSDVVGTAAGRRTPYDPEKRLPPGSGKGKVFAVTGGHGGIGASLPPFSSLREPTQPLRRLPQVSPPRNSSSSPAPASSSFPAPSPKSTKPSTTSSRSSTTSPSAAASPSTAST